MTNFDGVSAEARADTQTLISAIARADAALDLEGFLALLAPDAVMRIGSQPALVGVHAIRAAIAGLFGAMRSGVIHEVTRVWGDNTSLVYQAEATFPLKDGRDLTLPYVNVLDVGPDRRVLRYVIAIDLAPMRGA
jgi:ketosteroid isomerase-like protein